MGQTQPGLWLRLVVLAGCTEKEDGDGVIDTVEECGRLRHRVSG
ncbi:MAG: hypothetical protein ACRBN8_01955 [Nannocystales bacterium]